MYTIPGHHHISMITKKAKRIIDFYQEILRFTSCEKDSESRYPDYVSFILR